MHPKDADGMANSVDPDQTASSEAVWSWSALFAETYLSQYIEFVWYVSLYQIGQFRRVFFLIKIQKGFSKHSFIILKHNMITLKY